jgi:hypothetical protein
MCTGGGGVIPVVQEGCRALRERRSAPGATAMAVSEACHPLVEKPLDPFVATLMEPRRVSEGA